MRKFPKDMSDVHRLLKQARAPWMDIVVNCIHYMRDTDNRNRAHVRCIGEHYLNLSAALFVNDAKLKGDFESIKTQLQEKLLERTSETHPKAVHIGFMCRQGRHRSVAACRLTIEVLKIKGYLVDREAVYLSKSAGAWESDQCWTCKRCDINSEDKKHLYRMAVLVWNGSI